MKGLSDCGSKCLQAGIVMRHMKELRYDNYCSKHQSDACPSNRFGVSLVSDVELAYCS